MTVSSSLSVYQYIACAFTRLHFYIGACTFDDIGYDIVIVDENGKNKVFSLHSNVCIPMDSTVKILNTHPETIAFLLRGYLNPFISGNLQKRISKFLAGYDTYIKYAKNENVTHEEVMSYIEQQHFAEC